MRATRRPGKTPYPELTEIAQIPSLLQDCPSPKPQEQKFECAAWTQFGPGYFHAPAALPSGKEHLDPL
jgi:hypothetical protein